MFGSNQNENQANFQRKNLSGEKVTTLTWQPGDVILDLYEVRPVLEGLGESATEKNCHRGGFGQVYKVYHRGWNLELAMKAPLPGVFENEDQVEDFTRECETWVELGLHPHIVTCYYVRNFNSQPLVFAEYVSGGCLKEWIDSGLLYEGGPEEALKRILDIAIQTAWGLNYAHEQGLVHQDVKPANVMLTPEGQAKISDFGAARARAKAASGTTTVSPGTTLVSQGGMTPAYCSPEQSLGEKLTRRTDIWSWGLMVLEMFAGEVTWASGVAAAQALQAYLYHGGEAEEIPSMPQDLALLLERCFSSEQVRPQNFSQITDELIQIYRNSCGLDYPSKEPKAADNYAGSLNNRALSMHDLGRIKEAEKLWAEALQYEPTHLAATYNLGLIQWRSGKINDDVLVQKIEGLRQGQPTARAAYLLAMVHAERFDYQTAIVYLEEAVAVAESEAYEIGALLNILKPLTVEGARCLRTFGGHIAPFTSVSLSSNNRYALSGSNDKTLKLWDVESGRCLRTFEGHTDSVDSVDLSANGHYALSGSRDETLKLWEMEGGRCLRTFKGHVGWVNSVCLSADGRYAFSGSWDKTLKMWDVESGRCLRTFEGHMRIVYNVCMSSDSCCVLSGSGDQTLKLWDVESGECLRTLEGHTGSVNSICLSTDGHFALSGSDDQTIKLWEVESGRCLRTFEGHTDIVSSVCLSADKSYALSGSRDSTLKLWVVENGRCLRTFKGHTHWVNSVCLSTDGLYTLTGSWDKSVKLWSLPWSKTVVNLFTSQLEVSLVLRTEDALSAEEVSNECFIKAQRAIELGKTKIALLALQASRALPGRIFDRQFFNLWAKLYSHFNRSKYLDCWHIRTLKGHSGAVNSVCLSTDRRYALSGSGDQTLKLWDVESGECLRTFEGHTWRDVKSVCLSSDGCYALSGSMDETLKLWELKSGRCLRTFKGHDGWVNSVCLSADGHLALSGGYDQTLKIWEIESGRCLRTLEGHTGSVYSVSLSADGHFALSGGYDQTIKLWEVESGRCLRTFEGHTDDVNSVYLTLDSHFALTGSKDNTLKLWEVESGRCLRTFEGHTGYVTSVCLSSDNNYALSGSKDSFSNEYTIKLWDVENGKCLSTLEGHTSGVTSICMSIDGRYALSGSEDNTLKLWELYWELE